ncbi:hypothetical protein EON66_12365, partial [archaeon]
MPRVLYFPAAGAEAKAAESISSMPDETADEHKARVKAVTKFEALRDLVAAQRAALDAMSERRIQPAAEVVKALIPCLAALGYTRAQLGEPTAADPSAFVWSVARVVLHDADFMHRVTTYDVNTGALRATAAYQKPDAVRAALAEVRNEEV